MKNVNKNMLSGTSDTEICERKPALVLMITDVPRFLDTRGFT